MIPATRREELLIKDWKADATISGYCNQHGQSRIGTRTDSVSLTRVDRVPQRDLSSFGFKPESDHQQAGQHLGPPLGHRRRAHDGHSDWQASTDDGEDESFEDGERGAEGEVAKVCGTGLCHEDRQEFKSDVAQEYTSLPRGSKGEGHKSKAGDLARGTGTTAQGLRLPRLADQEDKFCCG